MTLKPCIAVDFDGTIVEHRFPAVGELKPGAREALQRFRELGYHVLIYSCRTCKWHPEVFCKPGEVLDMNRDTIQNMITFLDTNQIPYDEIDDGTKGKPLAEYYIDDKGVAFKNNWNEITTYIEEATHCHDQRNLKHHLLPRVIPPRS